MGEMNFKELDKVIDFKYATDKYRAAKNLGFEYISEAVIKLYPGHSSFYLAECFDVYHSTIRFWLKIWGIKRKSRGDQGRWIKKYGSDNCINCGAKTHIGYRTNGRCGKCYRYFHRHGIEHPDGVSRKNMADQKKIHIMGLSKLR